VPFISLGHGNEAAPVDLYDPLLPTCSYLLAHRRNVLGLLGKE